MATAEDPGLAARINEESASCLDSHYQEVVRRLIAEDPRVKFDDIEELIHYIQNGDIAERLYKLLNDALRP